MRFIKIKNKVLITKKLLYQVLKIIKSNLNKNLI